MNSGKSLSDNYTCETSVTLALLLSYYLCTMEDDILYKSKSYTHKFLGKALGISLLIATALAAPFAFVFGFGQLHFYVMFKASSVFFAGFYIYLFAKQVLYTKEGIVFKYSFRKKIIRSYKWNEVGDIFFRPISNSIIGRLVVVDIQGKELPAVVPEDDLVEIDEKLRPYGFEIRNIPEIKKKAYGRYEPKKA